jgi:hypothetical protein
VECYINGQSDIRFHNITSGCSHFYISNWFHSNTVSINHFKILKSAEINMQSNIDSLTVTGGQEIRMGNESKLRINNIIANNPCNSIVNISTTDWLSSDNNISPTIILSKPHSLTRFSVAGITVQGSVPVVLSQSIDRGGNVGFQFSGSTGRTLYWVGGSGDWDEQIHWSLISGGPGGECVPTENDDVIFDSRSFTTNNDFVTFGKTLTAVAFCKNLTFNVPGYTGSFFLNILKVYGNLSVQQAFNYNIYRTEFHNHTGIQTVYAPSIKFKNFTVTGKSEVKLLSPIHIEFDFRCTDGGFDTGGYDVVVDLKCYFGNYGTKKKPVIKLRTSNFTINGNNVQYNEPLTCLKFLTLQGDSSRIVLTNNSTAAVIHSTECKFGEMVASSITGIADIASYQNTSIRKLILRGDGKFINFQFTNNFGALTLDTLILSAGKSYNYEATYTQTINKYLQARGNNCNPISIFSSLSGAKGIISMPASASINMDFVQMRDMRGIGGAIFNAGPYSTNINNSNENWIFPGVTSITENVGFLGPDRLICPGMNGVILDANSFTPTETYTWSNGSTASSLNAQNSGDYAVTVTFANSCKVIDTIKVTKAQDIGKLLPKDTSLCNQSNYTLIPLINDSAAKYLWNTGSSSSQLNVSSNGKYTLQFTKDGCTFSDSTQVSFINIHPVNLGNDTSVCQPNKIVLNVPSGSPFIRWQDGSSNLIFTAQNTGLYWVEVGSGQCKSRDSINLVFNPLPVFNLGPDTTFCGLRSTLELTTGSGPGTTTWQDGSSGNNFTVRIGNSYSAVKTLNGCTYSDTIKVDQIRLGNESSLTKIHTCQSRQSFWQYSYSGATFKWSEGLTPTNLDSSFIKIGERVNFPNNKSGIYWVDIDWNGCKVRDSFEITFIAPVNFGRDTALCSGDTLILTTGDVVGFTRWQDGSVNNKFTVTKPGTYFAVKTSYACTSSDTISVNYKLISNPIQKFNGCEGPPFPEQGYIYPDATFKWSPGLTPFPVLINGIPSGEQVKFTTSGIYWVDIELDGCKVRDSFDINLKSLPVFNLGSDTSFCQGNSIVLSHGVTNGQVIWNDGSTAPNLSAQTSGQYMAKVTFNGCSYSDTININVKPLPLVNLGADTILCENTSLSLNAGPGTGLVLWSNNSTQNQITVNTTGHYFVTKTTDGCSKTDSINVSYVTLQKPSLGQDTSFCDGITVQLKDASSAQNVKYLWSDGTTNTSLSASKSGIYWVETSMTGCKKRDSININILPLPKVSSPKDYSFCEGKNVAVALQGDFNSIKWDDFPSQQNIEVSTAKNYKYTISKGLCELRSEINVREVKIPDPDIGEYIDKCRGEPQTLSIGDFNGNVKWSTGAQSKTIQVITSGTYVVTLTDSGCTKTDSVFVGFFECNGEFLYFPNIINPLSANGNEKFLPIVAEKYTLTQYKLSVYDRFGNLLFMTEDLNSHWDGRQFGNRELQPGVFTYICTASADGPKKFENKIFTGTITLLR